jgi:RND family efflux transporter MFP subunit
LRNAQGGLERAKATSARAKLDLDRMVSAQKQNPGAVSEASIDQARETVEVTKADITSFQASVETAEDALKYTNLRAPFAGTIVATYVENFENVRAQQMVVRLLDKTQIEFEVGIPETLISLAPYVEDIKVTFDAFPDVEVPATILEIGREASATTRTFPVTVIMDQPENASILPGMAGRATGKPSPPDSAAPITLVVPVTAVFAPETADQSCVWVIDETSKAVTLRPVDLGDAISSGFVVESGLEKGEMIATAGVHFLKEGQVVAPTFQ